VVAVSFKEKVEVRFDPATVGLDQIRAAIVGEGFVVAQAV